MIVTNCSIHVLNHLTCSRVAVLENVGDEKLITSAGLFSQLTCQDLVGENKLFSRVKSAN